ncbi:MAG TPA: helix-turn-helix transcriptional regulator [Capsulimonadaceae bacterium]|jgi:transcriptional regulator with XRE-family HTH domain
MGWYYYDNAWKRDTPPYAERDRQRRPSPQRLEHLRKVHGLQGRKLAEKLGISVSYLNFLISGKRRMDNDMRAALSRALYTKQSWLFEYGWNDDFSVPDRQRDAIDERDKAKKRRMRKSEIKEHNEYMTLTDQTNFEQSPIDELTNVFERLSKRDKAILLNIARTMDGTG